MSVGGMNEEEGGESGEGAENYKNAEERGSVLIVAILMETYGAGEYHGECDEVAEFAVEADVADEGQDIPGQDLEPAAGRQEYEEEQDEDGAGDNLFVAIAKEQE